MVALLVKILDVDTTKHLSLLRRTFSKTKKPIEVNFRDLVYWIPYNSNRFTHQIHTYPAKLIPQIPEFFLSSELGHNSSSVLDPFCGSGTVLLEASLKGKRVVGSDSNPLARLISEVKLRPIKSEVMRKTGECIRANLSSSKYESPDVVNLEYWFYPHVIRDLLKIRHGISQIRERHLMNAALVAFSNCVRKVSLADPKVSVPVRLRAERYASSPLLHEQVEKRLRYLRRVDVIQLFFRIFDDVSSRVDSLLLIHKNLGKLDRIFEDSCNSSKRSLHSLGGESIDLIITSPPYLGAQKYVRATSLNLGWLEMVGSNDLRALEKRCVGREHLSKEDCTNDHTGLQTVDRLLSRTKNETRRNIARCYLREMNLALHQCWRVLSPGGSMILVAGANTLCNEVFDTPVYLQQLAEKIGFETELILIDHIKSRGLMTRRNKTAGMIPAERVIWLTKSN